MDVRKLMKDIQVIKKENREYYKSHVACPVCGSVETGQTYLGFLRPPDLNKAWCSCGWEGVVDDLKGKEGDA